MAENIPGLSSALAVRICVDADGARWDAYVDAAAKATVSHRWAWRRILQEVFGHRCHYLIAERDGAVAGVLPLAEVKTLLFGHSLVSLPFCAHAGPIADDEATLLALEAHAVELANETGVQHLELRGRADAAARDWPSNEETYVEFSRPILADADENLRAIPGKQRNMVRKGMKNGLVSELADVKTMFPLHAQNMHRHGTPTFPQRYFDALLEGFGNDAEILLVRRTHGVEPLSCMISLFFRNQMSALNAGDTLQARALAANHFLYWQLICRAAERGCDTFSSGRSKRGTGSFDFKDNWGFTPTPLRYDYRLLRRNEIPQNNPLNPKYRLLIGAWRRMPGWFVNRAGPMLIRGLG
ncbi:MAG: FemAB family PEP-CTERM system-associated protein [Burkholderiaceae bacterium]|nr:FemAB family PEP-CTERM system-associated protein [Burkholderiaceae bacterium]